MFWCNFHDDEWLHILLLDVLHLLYQRLDFELCLVVVGVCFANIIIVKHVGVVQFVIGRGGGMWKGWGMVLCRFAWISRFGQVNRKLCFSDKQC